VHEGAKAVARLRPGLRVWGFRHYDSRLGLSAGVHVLSII
jgi:hypothetical protein